MGGKINTEQFVDANGYRIYVCCAECKKKITADPDKYIQKMQNEGVTLEKAPIPQTTCPVMKGTKINKKLYVDANGYRIYVCCGVCESKVKADPDKYIKQMTEKGIAIEKLPKKETPKKPTPAP